MKDQDEVVLKVTKEIVVKFIEVGRLSVNSFEEVWGQVHTAIKKSVIPEPKDSAEKP
jgi:predicted transcriptional regulator